MKLTKILSIIMAFLLAGAVMLTSCGSSDGENGNDKPSNKNDKSELSDTNNDDDEVSHDVAEDFSWTLDDGVLTISGTGAMPNYWYEGDNQSPWSEYRTEITSVIIEDGITHIGSYAFANCFRLTSITIPDSVTSIGDDAFSRCSSLTSIEVESDNKNYTSVEGVLFDKGMTTLVTHPAGKSNTYYEVPDSVTSIGDRAFYGCDSLTSITIPDSVTSIGNSAFSCCSKLTSITIPDSVTSIGSSAFYGCTSLTSITIPDSVTSIGDGAFFRCSKLKSITIPDSVTSIGDGAFSYCTSLTNIAIPDSVISIGSHAFEYCISLTDIYFGGTRDEWNAMAPDNMDIPQNAAVHCSDGDI